MSPEVLLLWFFGLCGAATAWSSVEASNAMTESPPGTTRADPWGWSMTGMVGLWAAFQPFLDRPIQVTIPVAVMALSLSVQSWRLAHANRPLVG